MDNRKIISSLILSYFLICQSSVVFATSEITPAVPTTTLTVTKTVNFSDELKTNIDQNKEKNNAQKQEFLNKLQTIKDEKKKQIVEKVNTRLATVNSNWTQMWTNVLQRLTTILDRLSSKVATAKSKGIDTIAVEAAINEAKTAIAAAQTAVTAQAAKTYTVTIETEETLKTTVGNTVSQLHTDLKTTRQLVVNARQAVQKAITEFTKLRHNEIKNETTPAVEPTRVNVTGT